MAENTTLPTRGRGSNRGIKATEKDTAVKSKNNKLFIALGVVAGVFLAVAAVVGGVYGDRSNRRGKALDAAKQEITDITADRDQAKNDLEEMQTKQEFSPSEDQLKVFKDMATKRGGSVESFEGFTCTGDDLLLVFNGKAGDGKTPVKFSVSMKADFAAGKTSFTTDDVMSWLDAQSNSSNPDEWPEVSVFSDVATRQYSSVKDKVNAIVGAIQRKETVVGEVEEDGTIPVYKTDTMFSITPSDTADANGNYKLSVKRLVKDENGKYQIQEVGKKISVNDYVAHTEERVAVGLDAYCQEYEVSYQTPEQGPEA